MRVHVWLLLANAAAKAPFFKRLGEEGKIVIGQDQCQSLGIVGLEGSFYTRTSDGVYHYLSAGRIPQAPEWPKAPSDVHMRMDRWTSTDGRSWKHAGKLRQSTGVYDGTDRNASFWAPMAAFDPEEDYWHMFYIRYRTSPDFTYNLGLYGNNKLHSVQHFDGEVRHAKAAVKGELGIGGDFVEVGSVLNQEELGGFAPSKDSWEGDHGVDMFFPYRLGNGSWIALYGSEQGRFPDWCGAPDQSVAPTCRQVGLATPQRAGLSSTEWTRLSHLNPLDKGFRPAKPGIENPVVTKTQDGEWYIAVYHIYTGPTIGVSFSKDGVNWIRQEGDLMLGNKYCGDVVTTANGLVPEPSMGKGVYSLLYNAFGKCTTNSSACAFENTCYAYLVNEAERDADDSEVLV